MKRYLLSVAIGPVQDFIAAARRTRDLAYGSQLLSEVSKACARYLRDECGAELVFPATGTADDLMPNRTFMAVNKILAVVHAEGEAGMVALAGACKQHVKGYLAAHELDRALRRAKETLEPDGYQIDDSLARQHVRTLSEFYAGWAEWERDEEYPECRDLAERRVAARKALRDFAPHEGKSGIPKSSLDGFRESVLTRTSAGEAKQYLVRPEEQLDGVGLLKRFGGGELRFESTIDVAAGPYERRLQAAYRGEWEAYRTFLEAHKRQLPRTRSAGYLYRMESRQIENEKLRGELEAIVKRMPEPKPPYYALLIGDGDGMGVVLGGIARKEEHQKFSKQLSEFAMAAKQVIDDHDGQCVYAGGDDVMALLPLDRALACAKGIRKVFGEQMSKWPVTFSAGMAVAHALEPLDEVRRMAQAAEREAKAVPKKDALAVVVSPRSGSEVLTKGKWEPVTEGLERIAELYLQGQLSRSLGHEYRQLLERWRGDEAAERELDEALGPLALAIARRKDERKVAEELLAGVGSRPELEFLTNNLFVARVFERAKREAAGK